MSASIKMDELLVSWLGSDTVYENVEKLIEEYTKSNNSNNSNSGSAAATRVAGGPGGGGGGGAFGGGKGGGKGSSGGGVAVSSVASSDEKEDGGSTKSPRGVIPPFYPKDNRFTRRRRWNPAQPIDTWLATADNMNTTATSNNSSSVRDVVQKIMKELELKSFKLENFARVTKEVFGFPSFFNAPLFQRITTKWANYKKKKGSPLKKPGEKITPECLKWYWTQEMEPYDTTERFFRLLKQPTADHVARDDFLPFIKELLADHPGLEFLSDHAEFQEKYAVTVITRIFYSVNRCHSGRITLRQIRRSDLLEAFQQVDEEEDINKVTRYFSYEHFYVLYCRFWELDHDRDYRVTREDLIKYGDHSLSHMIVDRIFDAAPRPFQTDNKEESKDYLTYEDFIFFMLSEEDKANEISVKYWFACVDVDGDNKLNNMEMRSFYAVQLHRMQCMGHEIVPFEDMLCQMMDMIKPKHPDYFVAEDFLQTECAQVSGALFDALFNLNKYLMFEQRDPFVERQKREDEFETDWDRFACIDYNRLAMEEEAREEEAMEIDWVTVDDEDEDHEGFETAGSSEAPF